MAFEYTNKRGTTYYLHSRTTKLESGKERTLYFFSKEKADAADAIPKGYEVSESPNGLPVLRRADKDK